MRRDASILVILMAGAIPAHADTPMSAIDWLSQSVATPVVQAGDNATRPPLPPPNEAPVVDGASPDDVTVTSLDAPNLDAVGLLSSQTTGLPANLWGLGRTNDIATLVTQDRAEVLPSLRQLLVTILLAEATPPPDSDGTGQLLRSRTDKLLALGALDQAEALLAAAGSTDAELFRRSFDVALLAGTEDAACKTLTQTPSLSPTFPARIFCLARSGDWNAAALSLRTGVTLGDIPPEDEALIARFLDPDLFEGEPVPPRPDRVTPLVWRMFQAIGEPLPTANLPLAFSHADLSERSGWKARLEAAERLASAGTIAPNLLLGLYTERDPAASGGVWDRVLAFQKFDAALAARDPARVGTTLAPAWAAMESQQLEVTFAALYAERLATMDLTGDAGALAFRVGLLSPFFKDIATTHAPANARETFLKGIATGSVEGMVAPDGMGRAIGPAFVAPLPSDAALALLEDERLGEALLLSIDQITRGVTGELRGVTDGLALLRHIGLEDVARRTALELMILERRG
jgi:hypothetical protein